MEYDKTDLVSYHFDRSRILAEDGPRIQDLVSGLKGWNTFREREFPLLLRDRLHLFLLEKPLA